MSDIKPYIVNGERKSHTDYLKTKYEDLRIRVPLGKKEQIGQFVQLSGESVNAFVNRAIDEAMQRDVSTTDTPTQKKESIPPKENA